jgi:hypothetical protein
MVGRMVKDVRVISSSKCLHTCAVHVRRRAATCAVHVRRMPSVRPSRPPVLPPSITRTWPNHVAGQGTCKPASCWVMETSNVFSSKKEPYPADSSRARKKLKIYREFPSRDHAQRPFVSRKKCIFLLSAKRKTENPPPLTLALRVQRIWSPARPWGCQGSGSSDRSNS